MPKIITMREMLAGAPTGVRGINGIGHYEPAGLAESTYSPYDQPGLSDRLWHHAAVGDIVSSQPPPAGKLPIDIPGVAQAMCAAAGKVWDDTTKQCLTKDLPPKKPPFWTPMTTALVALGIVGIGAVWAFGGGTKKKAKKNPRSARGHATLRHRRHQKPYEVVTSYFGTGKASATRRFSTHGQAYRYAIKHSKQLRGDQSAMVELHDAEGYTEQFDPGSW